jgi:hypothetical protein
VRITVVCASQAIHSVSFAKRRGVRCHLGFWVKVPPQRMGFSEVSLCAMG